MHRAFRALEGSVVIGSFLASLVVGLLASPPARAADAKVVLEQFQGPGATKFREQVRKAAKGLGADVVSDKKLASTEADLGLMQAADAYGAVAKQLGATNFISGSVKGRRPVATLVVKDSEGKKVGQKVFRGKNPRQLAATLDRQLGGALAELLGSSGKGAAVVAEAKPSRETRKESSKPSRAAAEPADSESETEGEDEEEDDEGEDEAADAGEPEAEEEETSAQASDEPATSSTAGFLGGRKGLDASAGVYFYQRQFTYNEKVAGDQEEYKTNPVAPAVALNVEYFFLPYLGLAVGGDYTIGLSSAKGNTTFATTAMTFFGGPKGKLTFGSLEVNLLAAYAKQTFKLEREVNDVASNVPDADYSMVRAVLGVAYDLGAVSLFGTYGYDLVLDVGTFKDAFPNATAGATEGSLGLLVPLRFLLDGLDVRAAFVARSFGITMNSDAGDTNRAGGATDRYMGGVVSVGYRLD